MCVCVLQFIPANSLSTSRHCHRSSRRRATFSLLDYLNPSTKILCDAYDISEQWHIQTAHTNLLKFTLFIFFDKKIELLWMDVNELACVTIWRAALAAGDYQVNSFCFALGTSRLVNVPFNSMLAHKQTWTRRTKMLLIADSRVFLSKYDCRMNSNWMLKMIVWLRTLVFT